MRHSLSLLSALSLAFGLLPASTAMAATITWQTPVNQTGNATDVVTNGTLVGAATAGPAVTVNGVSFDTLGSSNISVANLLVPYTSQYSNVPNTWDSNYATLVGGAGYNTSNNPVTMTLSGLSAGQSYEVQLFEAFWNNNWATNFTGGGSTSANVNGSGPNQGAGESDTAQYLLGTFTADGSTETITLGSPTQYVIFDAAQVRGESIAATPEPSSLMLLGTGVLSVAGVIRRRIK